MKLTGALAVLPLFAVGAQGADRPVYAGMPPERYQGDFAAPTIFSSDAQADCLALHGRDAPVAGYRIVACAGFLNTGSPVIVLPNPCAFPHEQFATLACHEGAHLRGWPSGHPE